MSNDSKTLELQIRIAAQEAARTVTSLKGEVQTLAVEAGKFSKTEGAALGKSFKDAEAAAKDAVSGVGDLKNAVMRLAEVVALAKALSVVKDMGAFALQAADNFQTARSQFGVLLGDMEAGAGLFNEIKAFNDKTPFDLSTLTQTTNVLIAAKVPLQDLQAQLAKFGDLSQGNSQRLTSYVNAFSQAAAKGKADMQVLNTYLHQGVPILDALAKNFNVTTAEIVEMSSEGKISFEEFSRALDDMTAAGGQYFGGMELASKSLAAMQEGLKESVNSLAASFGEMLLPSAVGVAGIFTDITNAINENPLFKGWLTAVIVTVTGYMAAMAAKAVVLAAKTWLAQAAQTGFNASLAVTNPLLIAGIVAAAAATAAYVAYAAQQQKTTRAAEDLALAQRRLNDAIGDGASAVQQFYRDSQKFDFSAALYHVRRLQSEIDEMRRSGREGEAGVLRALTDDLRSASERFVALRDDFIKEFYNTTNENKIIELRDRISTAETYMVTVDISREDRNKLGEIIARARDEITKLLGDIDDKAATWKKNWAEIYGQFQADQMNDPFFGIELEREKTKLDAWNNYVRDGNKETIDQINEYYNAKRGEIIQRLADEEERIRRELSGTKIDDLEHELKEALRAINVLEEQRVIAAADSEEEIAAIRERFAQVREDTEVKFQAEISRARYEEAMEAAWSLAAEEERIRRELSGTKIDDLEYELKEALRAINVLEEQRVLAAANSEEEIAAIRERFAMMREDTELKFKVEIDTAKLEEAREAVKNWQQELSDSLLLAIMDLEIFSVQASVIISGLSSQLAQLSASATLSGFEEFGRALGEGEDAAESMGRALAEMAQQILKQLPMMFLQAGLQLIANGQWPLGLGFIAAAGSSAIISGYVDGASKHAQGGVFDEYGAAARTFAAGGAFTNQIVNAPTYFQHGGGFGLMGEAGPEAIMPLARMPNGSLGVQTAGSGAQVIVNVINNSGAEVRQEEREGAGGGKQIDVIIGEMVNRHIASGKADRALGGRYSLRAAGV